MQHEGESLEMPGSFKSSRDRNENDFNEAHYANSSIANNNSMRASSNVKNPLTSVFDIDNNFNAAAGAGGDANSTAPNTLNTPAVRQGRARRQSLSDTVKSGATSAAHSAAAAGASVIEAARKLMHLNNNDDDDNLDHRDGNDEGILPTSDHSAGMSRTKDDSHGLEFSHRSMYKKKPTPASGGVTAIPRKILSEETDSSLNPTPAVREPFERRHSSPSLIEQQGKNTSDKLHSDTTEKLPDSSNIETTAIPEVRNNPVGQSPSEWSTEHSSFSHTKPTYDNSRENDTAAAGITALAAAADLDGNDESEPPRHSSIIVDRTRPPASNQHTAYIATDPVSVTSPPSKQRVKDTFDSEDYIFGSQDAPESRSADADIYSSKFTNYSDDENASKEKSTRVPASTPIENYDSYLSQKTHDPTYASKAPAPAPRTTESTYDSNAPVPAPRTRGYSHDTKDLNTTDPTALNPDTEVRTLPISDETKRRSLTDKVKDTLRRSSKDGPADPNDLPLTDPSALGMSDREISRPAESSTLEETSSNWKNSSMRPRSPVQFSPAVDTIMDRELSEPAETSRTKVAYPPPVIPAVLPTNSLTSEDTSANWKDYPLSSRQPIHAAPIDSKIADRDISKPTLDSANKTQAPSGVTIPILFPTNSPTPEGTSANWKDSSVHISPLQSSPMGDTTMGKDVSKPLVSTTKTTRMDSDIPVAFSTNSPTLEETTSNWKSSNPYRSSVDAAPISPRSADRDNSQPTMDTANIIRAAPVAPVVVTNDPSTLDSTSTDWKSYPLSSEPPMVDTSSSAAAALVPGVVATKIVREDYDIPKSCSTRSPTLDEYESTKPSQYSSRPLNSRAPASGAASLDTTASISSGAGIPAMNRNSSSFVRRRSTTSSLDKKNLNFTNPMTLSPLTEVRTIPILDETHKRSLTDKVKQAMHRSSEYGPADPRELRLTDPRTLGQFNERGTLQNSTSSSSIPRHASNRNNDDVAIVSTGAAVATMSPRSNSRYGTEADITAPNTAQSRAMPATTTTRTTTTTYRDPNKSLDTTDPALVDNRTVPVNNEPRRKSSKGNAKDTKQSPSYYGTGATDTAAMGAGAADADMRGKSTRSTSGMQDSAVAPNELYSSRKMNTSSSFDNNDGSSRAFNQSEKNRLNSASSVRPADNDQMIVIPPPQPPADMKTLNFTDPNTLTPLTEVRILTLVEETPFARAMTTRIKDVFHRSSEHGPADPKDLSLTDPKSLRPLGEKAAAPTSTSKASSVASPVATAPPRSSSSQRVNTAKSSQRTSNEQRQPRRENSSEQSSRVKPVVATATVGTAGAAIAAMPSHTVSPVRTTTEIPASSRNNSDRALRTKASTQVAPVAPVVEDDYSRPQKNSSVNTKDLKLTDTRPLRPAGEKATAPVASPRTKEATATNPSSSSTQSSIPAFAPLPTIAPLSIPMDTSQSDVTTAEDYNNRRPMTANASSKATPIPAARPRSSTNPFDGMTDSEAASKARVDPIYTTNINPALSSSGNATTAKSANKPTKTPTSATTRQTNPFVADVAVAAPTATAIGAVESKKPRVAQKAEVAPNKQVNPTTNNTTTTATNKNKSVNAPVSASLVTPAATTVVTPIAASVATPTVAPSTEPRLQKLDVKPTSVNTTNVTSTSQTLHPNYGSHYGLTDNSIVAESSTGSSTAGSGNKLMVVPENYEGPIPKVQPGEEIVWMKTTTTTTYPEGVDVEQEPYLDNTNLSPAQIHNLQQQQETGSDFSPITFDNTSSSSAKKKGFLGKLLGRRKSSADKGKQRV
ncbi:hypothetical protein BGZ46_006124 [Entomortierella lignicola]|nr:hypothetical protein BGZ46_006124 [Entomortierella lignicola]